MTTPLGPDASLGPGAAVDAVRAACLAAGEPDPLDEATARRLSRPLGDGAALVHRDAGFGFLHDGALDLAVAPAARGRGVGTAIAVEVAARPGGVRSAWSHGDHPAAARLAPRLGLVRARELWVMRRPTSLPLPALVVPEGVAIRGYRPEDAPAVLAVNAAAFAHHPEQGGMDADDLAARMAQPWFDPAGLLLAYDDAPSPAGDAGGLLAFHWTKRHSRTLGEVYVVAVAPQAQGRGLGRVVTLAGLHHLADTDEVLLYVEADNAAAVRLYQGLGFTHAATDTHVQYRLPD